MNRAKRALVVMVLASLGLWGCAQEQGRGGAARVRALEAKNAKLEEDYKALLTARDEVRSRLEAAEEQRARLEQQLELAQKVKKERDELRQQVTARTTERDALQGQLDQVRKGIRNLLGQVESASNAAGQPVTSAPASRADEKS